VRREERSFWVELVLKDAGGGWWSKEKRQRTEKEEIRDQQVELASNRDGAGGRMEARTSALWHVFRCSVGRYPRGLLIDRRVTGREKNEEEKKETSKARGRAHHSAHLEIRSRSASRFPSSPPSPLRRGVARFLHPPRNEE